MMRIAIGSDPNAAEEKYRLVEFIKNNKLVTWVILQILEVMM